MSADATGHWYTQEGTPRHTMKCKPGAKNPTRNTTIKDARNLHLLPSVSAYTKMLSAPALDYYKADQLAQACYESPAIHKETYAEWFPKMMEASKAGMGDAAQAGTAIHNAIEQYYTEPLLYEPYPVTFRGITTSSDEFVQPVAAKLTELGVNVLHAEKTVVNTAYGYAGTADVIFSSGEHYGVLDFKTKNTTKGRPIKDVETYPLQIAAYIAAHWGEDFDYPIGGQALGYSVYISRTEVGRVDVKTWSYEELLESWAAFKNCLSLWRWRNKYDARLK